MDRPAKVSFIVGGLGVLLIASYAVIHIVFANSNNLQSLAVEESEMAKKKTVKKPVKKTTSKKTTPKKTTTKKTPVKKTVAKKKPVVGKKTKSALAKQKTVKEFKTAPEFVYRAHVTKVYDGDTITVDIDLGFNIIMRDQTIRLYGIDTPELRKEEKQQGIKVRDYVRDMILDRDVILETFKGKKGKYGRWLGTIYFTTRHTGQINLNQNLLDKGFAKPYSE